MLATLVFFLWRLSKCAWLGNNSENEKSVLLEVWISFWFAYLTNYSHFLRFFFPPHFISDVRPISLEAPNHFGKNTPVLHISEKKNKFGQFYSRMSLANHQLVLSLRITEHGKGLKWSSGLQPGTARGGLKHVVGGQISLKSRGTEDTHQIQAVALCVTAAARPQTVLGVQVGTTYLHSERGSGFESLEFKCPRQRMSGKQSCPRAQKQARDKTCETP